MPETANDHTTETTHSDQVHPTESPAKPRRTRASARPTTRPSGPSLPPLKRLPLPANQPREWYEEHNRRLKAMRLAIALLDTGVYHPANADNSRIRATAARIGVHPPSDRTCGMVRSLIR
ncbi:hypothetical protein [Streptomyces sp. NBC_01497]|uniref:hypothetical protein n=1 Tax=Streptomyces sp. NBC_01497 TaxID=2903885 RepID=UPI002E36C2AC|nr:hypothetical protein [Streptomyces sp. NBC_01497]